MAIGDDPIDDAARGVLADGAEMVGEGVAGSFARLGHEIGDVDARGVRFGDGGSDFWNEEIWEDAGVEGAGAEKNEVRLANGFDGFGKRAHGSREQSKFPDGSAAGGDARFTVNFASVLEGGDERNIGDGGRKDTTADGEDFAADADGFEKITRDVGKSREKEIAEVVADQSAASVETILKKMGEKVFILGEGDHAVADVAGRQDTIFTA